MEIQYSDELLIYMKKKKKSDIVVEFVECANSEIEVADLHVYLIDSKRADFFIDKKGYGTVSTQHGRVLFPRMKLNLSDIVSFELRKIFCFSFIKYSGISL